jgi:hypothetical protein
MSTMRCARKLLSYVWASPCSLVGLLFLLAGFMCGSINSGAYCFFPSIADQA